MNALKITGPVDLVAAIPALLGFACEQSVVVIGFDGTRVGVSARVDLPRTPEETVQAATALGRGVGAATPVVVVHVGAVDHKPITAVLRATFAEVRAVFTVADFQPTRTVRDEDGTPLGSLPDHRATPVALAHAVAGRPVVSDRNTLAGELDAGKPTVLAQAAADALADPRTRDAALLAVVGDPADRAPWVEVARHSTGTGRGHAAALLAAAYYAAGDGARARVAADVAQDNDPGNRLAALVGAALDNGVPPEVIRGVFRAAAQQQ